MEYELIIGTATLIVSTIPIIENKYEKIKEHRSKESESSSNIIKDKKDEPKNKPRPLHTAM